MNRAVFLFISLISWTLIHAQEESLANKPTFRNEYFTQLGFFKPFASSWKYPSEAFNMRPDIGYSFHFGLRHFDANQNKFIQFSVGRRMTYVAFEMKQDYVNELSPDYEVHVRMGGWQGITDVNFGFGSRVQLNRHFYIQPAFILGIGTKGGYEQVAGYLSSPNRTNIDSTELKIESYLTRYSSDLGLSIELSVEAGVKLGKRHSLGFQGSLVQYGIGFGERRSPIFNVHSGSYFIYSPHGSYGLNTTLFLKGYSLALTYHYSF